ncbi:hypothetical protein SDRG_15828 [Saprolegnia diclina VS20]|uniref:Uncharacterized protein n=1 Tax=Saprolegnia diclina (strain VS20) TaxID=1156394 RepID=T0PVP1_SAPDV|nr:hypothetical protein SDRG_15828 [Saprolegnia diclina VS20]EQC26341.1 hypothetical protein SDRG_15828 [Saprolegnia diclina VS20]|eukprot:XP_008620234.1 hypothetical protein SDRG_15828 [Saprolegnia diclina VS20]
MGTTTKSFADLIRAKLYVLLLMALSMIASLVWSRRGSTCPPAATTTTSTDDEIVARNQANLGAVRSHHRIAAMIFASPSVRRAILSRVIFVLQDGNTGEAMLLTLPFNRILRRRLEIMARRWLDATDGTITRSAVPETPPKQQQRRHRFYTNPFWSLRSQ